MTQSELDQLRQQLDAHAKAHVLPGQPPTPAPAPIVADGALSLPSGITLRGEIWGRSAPLWIEAGAVHSLGGPVSPGAPVWVAGESEVEVEAMVVRLRTMGYDRAQRDAKAGQL